MIYHIHLDLSQKAERKHYTFILVIDTDKINILIMINNIHLDTFILAIYTSILAREETLYVYLCLDADKINILIMINHIHLDLSQKAERKHYNFILVITPRENIIFLLSLIIYTSILAKRQRGNIIRLSLPRRR